MFEVGFSREIRRQVGRPKEHFASTVSRQPRVFSRVEDAKRGKLGEAVYRFRVDMGISRIALAELMGATDRSILKWEMGVCEPKRLAWLAFCRVRESYRRKMRKMGKDLDGGPVIRNGRVGRLRTIPLNCNDRMPAN